MVVLQNITWESEGESEFIINTAKVDKERGGVSSREYWVIAVNLQVFRGIWDSAEEIKQASAKTPNSPHRDSVRNREQ